jgi:DNA-binding SARP family transcriptional activator/tetratricopeptide (TPR) repeat protein
MAAMVTFRLLGAVEADADGRPIDLGHARQRSVLAVLLIEVNRTVPPDQLLDRVWADRRPQRGRGALWTYLSNLRQVLNGTEVRLERRSGGYVLAADPMTVDVHRFRDLVALAQTADRPDALRLLDEALGLWRGEALAGLDSPWLANARETLEAERHAAELDRNDLALAAGRHATLLGHLAQLAAAHPLDERLAGQAILALYRCGRQADALRRYERLRRRLAEELGADPGPRLQLLHQQMLSSDPALTVERSGGVLTAPLATPRHLPAPPRWFAGRARELAELDAAHATLDRSSTVVTVALSGTAGVGKTALALRWGHRVADKFIDGQLYVNLRGYGPREPMTPGQAVRVFLDALGVPPNRVPADLDAQVGLYRTVLTGRRMLVLLDNAVDADQVRPLLPATPGCLVLITSRNSLNGLVVTDGAHRIVLGLLPEDDARHLLDDRLGSARTDAEPEAVVRIVAGCARLPLALSVAAAYAGRHRNVPLAAIAGQLAGGLEMFDGGDATTDVRSVLSWSYRALTVEAARLFRLLGLHPGPDITELAAASLAGVPLGQAGPALTELIGAHLIDEHLPGRFMLHDLLHAYAGELSRAHDTDTERHAATARMVDHYLHTSHAAAVALHPLRQRIDIAPAAPGTHIETIADADQSLAWFAAEYPVLRTLVGQAGSLGYDVAAWQLASTLTDYLDRLGRWHDQVEVHNLALAAARRLGDAGAQAQAHRACARACMHLGGQDEAHAHYATAVELYVTLGDRAGQAHTHLGLGWVLEHQGRVAEAVEHDRKALALFRALDDPLGQARSLNNLGAHRGQLGDHEQTVADCGAALALFEQADDRFGQAAVYDSLGRAHHQLGRHDQAVGCYQRAAELLHEDGGHYYEAQTLMNLGEVHRDLGDSEAARLVWQRALDILEHLEHPDSETVRTRLKTLAGTDAAREPAVH